MSAAPNAVAASSSGGLSTFLQRNQRALLIGAAVAVAAGAGYYYSVSSASSAQAGGAQGGLTQEGEKKKKKKSKKSAGSNKQSAEQTSSEEKDASPAAASAAAGAQGAKDEEPDAGEYFRISLSQSLAPPKASVATSCQRDAQDALSRAGMLGYSTSSAVASHWDTVEGFNRGFLGAPSCPVELESARAEGMTLGSSRSFALATGAGRSLGSSAA